MAAPHDVSNGRYLLSYPAAFAAERGASLGRSLSATFTLAVREGTSPEPIGLPPLAPLRETGARINGREAQRPRARRSDAANHGGCAGFLMATRRPAPRASGLVVAG